MVRDEPKGIFEKVKDTFEGDEEKIEGFLDGLKRQIIFRLEMDDEETFNQYIKLYFGTNKPSNLVPKIVYSLGNEKALEIFNAYAEHFFAKGADGGNGVSFSSGR